MDTYIKKKEGTTYGEFYYLGNHPKVDKVQEMGGLCYVNGKISMSFYLQLKLTDGTIHNFECTDLMNGGEQVTHINAANKYLNSIK